MTRPKEILVPTTPHVAGDEDIGEIRNIVGFHIRLAHGAVYRHFTERFAELIVSDWTNQKPIILAWWTDLKAEEKNDKFGPVFHDLSGKFPSFVDVLQEVSDSSNNASDKDIMRLYELWEKTKSPRCANLLRRMGMALSKRDESGRGPTQ